MVRKTCLKLLIPNIYSLNNPVHLAILLILVQTINKNFTHPYAATESHIYRILPEALPPRVMLHVFGFRLELFPAQLL